MSAENRASGGTVLTLGILGLVLCPFLAPFAWGMGNRALEEVEYYEPANTGERGLIVAGRVCGIIGTLFLAIWLGAVLLSLCVNMLAPARSETGVYRSTGAHY